MDKPPPPPPLPSHIQKACKEQVRREYGYCTSSIENMVKALNTRNYRNAVNYLTDISVIETGVYRSIQNIITDWLRTTDIDEEDYGYYLEEADIFVRPLTKIGKLAGRTMTDALISVDSWISLVKGTYPPQAPYNRNPHNRNPHNRNPYNRNPLDTSGLLCDFCAKPGVTEIHTCLPFSMGGRMRAQFMSCSLCSRYIADRNIRALTTQAANMLPPAIPRKEARIMFRGLYSQFLNNLLTTHTIEPEHIFELQMLRARAKHVKCQFRTGHPLLGDCNDLAYIEVRHEGWKKSCLVCAAKSLGLDSAQEVILHPETRTLRD